jgi:hypothetical protein
MSVHDIYSKRSKKKTDVFIYEPLSEKLKIQIEHIWKNFFKQVGSDVSKEIWKAVHSIICEEHGKKTLLKDGFGGTYYESYKVEHYFDSLSNVDESLDVIEIIFRLINKTPKVLEQNHTHFYGSYKPEQAIEDLNTRFLENDFGYEYQEGKIIRIDNTLLHREIILETLEFISIPIFENANDEFINAHEHYRHKRQKECLNDCLKSLKTTLKIICKENKWTYKETDTAKTLIDICIKNNLIPKFLLSHFTSLRTSIESGVPTFRNKLGGHGQGTNKITVPDHFASYMLYLTGTTINFLVNCHQELNPNIKQNKNGR